MIVFFDQYPTIAGGQRVLLNIVESVKTVSPSIGFCIPLGGLLETTLRAKYCPDGVFQDASPPPLRHGRKGAFDAFRLLIYTLRGIFRHWRLARRASCLYANGGRQFPLVIALSLLARRPALYHLHIDHNVLEKRILGLVAPFKMTAFLIAISPYIRNRLIASRPGIERNGKLVLVENALSEDLSNSRFQDRFTRSGPLHLAVFGTVRPEKGQQMAVDLARRNPGIILHIVGPIGEGAEEWGAQLRADAPRNVIFHGFLPDIAATIDQLGIQISLVPSQWEEPFGLVAIESMSCSCVTIVLARGALSDIARKTGALLCRDGEEMHAEISRLAAIPSIELASLAKSQFQATLAAYHCARFADDMRRLLQPFMPAKQDRKAPRG